ncbi:MAG: hypothetical protein DSO07_04950 [Thermoproteota archaeon]|jgi:hypothetical protein|uniref:YbjN domain-containing protein n=1 Tax=Candidatus Methanodesulfokora washburnensis TaxID=2478471 RepID=A0A3R9QVL8_9CREN|nr:hypothetical protein [Candidatus Methanodesulfokores washburnensis]RSN73250.1 hypothetical protein D6D85_11035 [Candidatus Methanodesulfokores washburnensis]RZN61607.1 MAG: hypothetical protein EF810_04760 [Candidatus Methanodesulfokores washburnensis]TDA41365.1 MAG: hypothetical protein DSO07_04950 [Candidatus Korarchaeota archaeon]
MSSEDLVKKVKNILDGMNVRYEEGKVKDATFLISLWKTDKWSELEIDIVISPGDLVVLFSTLPVSSEGMESWLLNKNWDYNFAHFATDISGNVIIVSNIRGEDVSEELMRLSLASIIRAADDLKEAMEEEEGNPTE